MTFLPISIVIPAHDENGSIEEVVRRSHEVLERLGGGEILVVDDGSTDGTFETAAKMDVPGLRVLRHRRNRGLSAALGTGFSEARGLHIFFICADMQCDPLEAVPLMEEALLHGSDVVFGYRRDRREIKSFASMGYRLLCRLLFGIGLRDMNWVKGFHRDVIDSLILRPGWHRYLAILAVQDGFKYAEVETAYHPRLYGRSHFGFMRIPQSAMHMLALKFHISFSQQPLILFGFFGLLFLFLAALGLAYYVIDWLVFGEKLRQLLIPLLFLGLSGVQFILMGFLAETQAHHSHVIKQARRTGPDR